MFLFYSVDNNTLLDLHLDYLFFRMFFVSTCKVASSTQEEQRTNLSNPTILQQQIDSIDTQTSENNQHVSVRDVRSDVRDFPGATPFRA